MRDSLVSGPAPFLSGDCAVGPTGDVSTPERRSLRAYPPPMGDAIDAANAPTAEGFIEQLTPLGSTDGVRGGTALSQARAAGRGGPRHRDRRADGRRLRAGQGVHRYAAVRGGDPAGLPGPRGPGRRRQHHGLPGAEEADLSGAAPGAVRPLPPPTRPDQHVGPGRPECAVRRGRIPVRQAAHPVVRAGPVRGHVRAANRHRRHLLLHPAGRHRRHVHDRGDAGRRRGGSHPEGGGWMGARGRQARSASAARLPGPVRGDDAANDAPLRRRAPRTRRRRPTTWACAGKPRICRSHASYI